MDEAEILGNGGYVTLVEFGRAAALASPRCQVQGVNFQTTTSIYTLIQL